MSTPEEREWFEGSHPEGFRAAAGRAVEEAEKVFDGRREKYPKEYDVQLRITAEGVLSDYKVLISPRD